MTEASEKAITQTHDDDKASAEALAIEKEHLQQAVDEKAHAKADRTSKIMKKVSETKAKRSRAVQKRLQGLRIDKPTEDWVLAQLSAGMPWRTIAKEANLSMTSINRLRKRSKVTGRSDAQEVSALKKRIEYQSFKNASRALEELEYVPPVFDSTDYRNIAVGFGIIYDKARLAANQSTNNVAFSFSNAVLEAMRERKDEM